MKKLNVSLVPSAEKIATEIKGARLVYNSAEFAAQIKVTGIDSDTGELFKEDFLLTELDPEFQIMINDYITRKIAENINSKL